MAMDPIVAVVQQLAENVGRRGPRKPKGVMEAYHETHTVLQYYCQVDNMDGLAPLWSRLARGSKGEQQSILQQELSWVCTG